MQWFLVQGKHVMWLQFTCTVNPNLTYSALEHCVSNRLILDQPYIVYMYGNPHTYIIYDPPGSAFSMSASKVSPYGVVYREMFVLYGGRFLPGVNIHLFCHVIQVVEIKLASA